MKTFYLNQRLSARIFAALVMMSLIVSALPFTAAAADAEPATCTVEIVSNTNAFVRQTESDAEAVPTPVHTAWTASIPGATWIWGDDQTATSSADVTYTFRNTFGFVGTVTSATLYVASDNQHTAEVNEGTTFTSSDDTTFNSPETYVVPTTEILQGDNAFEVTVVNKGPQGDLANNPAGALYKLVIVGTPTVDSNCSIAYGDPIPVLGCTDDEAANYNPAATPGNEQAENCSYEKPVCKIGENLLKNGSFEDPAIEGSWAISAITDWTITKVIDGTATLGEIWRGYMPPSEGFQSVELGANEATQIAQTVATTPGATYELRFDFAARGTDAADNNVDALVDGELLMNANTGNTEWTTYSQTFVAADSSTDIALRDIGTPNSLGSLVDNAALCFVSAPEDGGGDDEEILYTIYGFVWHDDNRNDSWDGRGDDESAEEETLAGRTVYITNSEETLSATTDENGYYEFNVPAGTWVITEEPGNGWLQTATESHTVTVPVVEEEPEPTIIETALNFIIPVAHAQMIPKDAYGEYNFGNDRRSGGGGTSLGGDNDSDSDPDGEVLGDSDSIEDAPEGQVLGEQVDVVPVGAADTGAGGTANTIAFFQIAPAAFIRRK